MHRNSIWHTQPGWMLGRWVADRAGAISQLELDTGPDLVQENENEDDEDKDDSLALGAEMLNRCRAWSDI